MQVLAIHARNNLVIILCCRFDLNVDVVGYTYFTSDMNASFKDEFTWECYVSNQDTSKHHLVDVMTETEKALERESLAEVDMGKGATTVKFPCSDDVINALAQYKNKEKNLVQISVDTEKETINFVTSESGVQVDKVCSFVSEEAPRFTLFGWSHEHEGEQHVTNVFLYSCPESAPIKEKMLYSTVKSVVQDQIEASGTKVDSKMEVNTADEASEKEIRDTVHPPKEEEKKAFARPKKPGRGARRLTKK